jgi:uncharacterized membrane protein YuzA (DUF378 family)
MSRTTIAGDGLVGGATVGAVGQYLLAMGPDIRVIYCITGLAAVYMLGRIADRIVARVKGQAS